MLLNRRVLPIALIGLLALALPAQAGQALPRPQAAPAPHTAHTAQAARTTQAAQGRSLYVTNSLSDNIAAFTTDADGSPVPNGTPAPTPQGAAPGGIVIAPDGQTAYVAERDGDAVLTYAVGDDGALSPLSEPVPTGGETPFNIAITPDGRALYTANIDTGTISVFTIHDDGTIALLGDPVPTGSSSPRGLAITPDGRFLYVGHGRPLDTPTDILERFTIGADGGLSGERTVATTGGAGTGMGITPDGRFLYIVATTTDQVFGYRIDAYGDLTAAAGSPYPVSDHPEGVAMSPDGRTLFVASPSQVRPDTIHALSAFSVGTSGALTPVAGSPFTAGAGPVGIAVTPDGRFLYVSHFDDDQVYGFAIDSYGALTKTAGSPVPSGGRAPAFQALTIAPDQGPAASLSTMTTRAAVGRTAGLNASASGDADGTVVRYDWDFGDGTVARDAGPEPQHVYTRAGTFTARVTVTDDEGCSTARVFTGQVVLCNGSPAASATTAVTVR